MLQCQHSALRPVPFRAAFRIDPSGHLAMQIDKLIIENFQLFDQREFEFHPKFNLLVGVNGSGKTSLLRALAVALGGWAHAYIKDDRNHRPILDAEIRQVQVDQRFDRTKSTAITASGSATIIDRKIKKKEGHITWVTSRTESSGESTLKGGIRYGTYPAEYDLDFATLGQDALRFVELGEKFDLPLIAFYECDRIWKSDESINAIDSAKTQYSRFDAYLDCFHTGANHKLLGEWLFKNEMASLQKKQDTPVLLSIRSAAKMALEGCTGLRFDFEEGRVLVEFENQRITPFEHLSDGQRTILGLFCDLARRAAILNPHLLGEASSQTKGVVLIDELDLHLHPRWQRTIIDGLRKLFPQIQFICTTHSPFLIQSLREARLIMLDGRPEPDFANKSIEDIVEEIQGVAMPQRSQHYLDMMNAAEAYFALLHQGVPDDDVALAALKDQLDRLSAPFSDDPGYQALLKIERMAILGSRN
jgi:predicted ATP-binding protein involved in virulence